MSHQSLPGLPTQGSSPLAVRTVTVLGGKGFLGTAVRTRLTRSGLDVRTVAAPRVRWPRAAATNGGTPFDQLQPDPDLASPVVDQLAESLAGADVVVNAAGLATPTARATADLFGANALVPILAASACSLAGVRRFIHVSSIAVQAHGILDETMRTAAYTPYARSRALAEYLLLGGCDGLLRTNLETVAFRPTSVHGSDRALTRSLARLARSALSCVAGDGSAPTPQVLADDVAESIAYLVLTSQRVPRIVLQPSNGMTTGLLLQLLGGRQPRRVPARLARALVRPLTIGQARVGRAHAHAVRLEMLLFGRPQVRGWLAERGMVPTLRPETWTRLGVECADRRHFS